MRLVVELNGDLFELLQVNPDEKEKLHPINLVGFPAYWWEEWNSKTQNSYVRVWPIPRGKLNIFELKEIDLALPLLTRQIGV